MQPFVSVIVATYNSGPGLDRLLASLDAQSLPADRMDLVFVDDGSTDDTLRRLQRLAADRPNVQVRGIENSGWPSRPRNLGLELARGEYVVFADHDDEFLPDGLRRAYQAAAAAGSDVLNPKEVRTSGWAWGWRYYQQDVARHEPGDPAGILPMTPHKLYRRQFLLDHAITFPEGRRVLWEDVYFNIDVLSHAQVMSTLADYPVYHWVRTASNTSTTFGDDPAEYWANLRQVVEAAASADLAQQHRDWLVRHWHRTRFLSFVGPRLVQRDPERTAAAWPRLTAIVDDLVPEHLDAGLDPVLRARSQLLRAHRLDLLRALAPIDAAFTVTPVADQAHWDGRRLRVTVTATASDPAFRLRRLGDRVLRVLPAEVEAALTPDLLDVTGALDTAQVDLTVKGRASRATWGLPTTGTVELVAHPAHPDDSLTLRFTAHGELDLDAHPITGTTQESIWDLALRMTFAGLERHHAVQAAELDDLVLLDPARTDHGCAIAYRNDRGLLSVDTDGAKRGLMRVGELSETALPADPTGDVRVVVPRTRVFGTGTLAGQVLAGAATAPAQLHGDGGTAWLTFTVPSPTRAGRLKVQCAGRQRTSSWTVRPGPAGRPRLVAADGGSAGGDPASRSLAGRLRRLLGGARRSGG